MKQALLFLLIALPAVAGEPPDRGHIGLMLSLVNNKPLPGIKGAALPGLAVVEVIPGGPAEKAGIVAGDYVIRVNGKAVKNPTDWKEASALLEVGTEAKISVKRPGERGDSQTLILPVTPISQRENRELVAKHETAKIDRLAAEEREKQEQRAELEAEINRRMMAKPPLQIIGTRLGRDIIGQPDLALEVRNNRNQDIEAFEITVQCFTKFGDPVGALGTDNIYDGIAQRIVEARKTANHRWQLSWHNTTGLAKVRIKRVKLADGTTWSPADDDEGWIEARMK
jgi:membrane-associated protease RseP (regulator of RpoE activity)